MAVILDLEQLVRERADGEFRDLPLDTSTFHAGIMALNYEGVAADIQPRARDAVGVKPARPGAAPQPADVPREKSADPPGGPPAGEAAPRARGLGRTSPVVIPRRRRMEN